MPKVEKHNMEKVSGMKKMRRVRGVEKIERVREIEKVIEKIR